VEIRKNIGGALVMFASRVVSPSATAAEKPKSRGNGSGDGSCCAYTKKLFTEAVDCLAPNGPCKFNEVLFSYI